MMNKMCQADMYSISCNILKAFLHALVVLRSSYITGHMIQIDNKFGTHKIYLGLEFCDFVRTGRYNQHTAYTST